MVTGTKRKYEAAESGEAPAADNDDFLAMPGHLLRRCYQINVAIFLEECRAFDLTPLQFSTLAALHQFGAMDQATLGRVNALDRTTVATVLANLEQRKLVTRAQSDKDKRAKIVGITTAGRRTVKAALPHVRNTQQRILAPLSDGERNDLLILLKKLADANNELSRAPHRLP